MSRTTWSKVAKGAFAGAYAGLTTLGGILVGHATFSDVTDGQWVWIAVAVLVGFGGAFGLASWSGPGPKGGAGG